MRPDKRIGQKMMRIERRWLCPGNARTWSAFYKKVARKASREQGKRQCSDE